MWLRLRWRDAPGNLLREDGAYGPRTVTLQGQPLVVQTLADLHAPNTRLYEAVYGMTQEWANQLLTLGWQPSLPLAYDRDTSAVTLTLGQLAAQSPGTAQPTFHFVLNNVVTGDTRIPPYGLGYDAARARNLLPVPATQYGAPGPGNVYRYWDELPLQPPAGATRAEIELLYQGTSWEYVQFLHLANNRADPFLASTGQDMLDAWHATGMAAPETMATARWCRLPGTGEDLELRTGVANAAPDTTCAKTAGGGARVRFELQSPGGTFLGALGAFAFELYPEPGPAPLPALPGLQLDRIDAQVVFLGLAPAGAASEVTVPPGLAGLVLRVQGVVLAPAAANGLFAASSAHDVFLQ